MPAINVYEAKTNLSKLLEAVERGEEITIARAGRPIADLIPHRPRTPLRLGGMAGEVDFDSTTFDEPDQDIVDMFGLTD